MLTKISLCGAEKPIIKKRIDGKDVSLRSAFPYGAVISYTVEVPRKLGASAVVMRICKDTEGDADKPFSFCDTDGVTDIYTLSVDTADLCADSSDGLFYYELLFLRGFDTLFTDTFNNVDFSLEAHSAGRFLLLVYQKDYGTPEWFKGSTMYHIFVDRFFRGNGEVGTREDAVINDDWDNGIPQYPEKSGDAFSNNVFFGGNLWGVAEKLGYLKSIGVSVLYLSPIFTAYSNHKYDTGNYLEVDSMFGGDEAFDTLIREADKMGIRIILDGVFNHTGDDSIYFDRYGKFGGAGAYTDANSPFRDWFRFRRYPDEYETWWGIKILPKLNLANDGCRDYFVGEGGVIERYIRKGIGGWRLDVADELSDEFLDKLRITAKETSNGEAVIIGEVWENAAEKIAYGKRRRYFRGAQLDSVMNYPFKNGALAFLLDGDAEFFADILKQIYSTYPKFVCDSLMNLLGTHDTERILTVLGEGREDTDEPNRVLAVRTLNEAQREHAIRLLKIASVLQFTVYGVPSVFYGDEAGMEGYHDPFCRKPYPWGRENTELVSHYARLGEIRKNEAVLKDGEFCVEYAKDSAIVYKRYSDSDSLFVIANASAHSFAYEPCGEWTDILSDRRYCGEVEAYGCAILKRRDGNGTF